MNAALKSELLLYKLHVNRPLGKSTDIDLHRSTRKNRLLFTKVDVLPGVYITRNNRKIGVNILALVKRF